MFSIITPTYNHEPYLEACIESVLAQTYPHWEMIIVDDGSTDKTAQIAKLWAAKDRRIQYVYQENKGIHRLAETYNVALKKAKYPYIAILEGDDVWYTKKLEMQSAYLIQNPECVLLFGYADEIYDKQIFYTPRNLNQQDMLRASNKPIGSFIQFYMHHLIYPLTVVVKKDSLEKIGGFMQNNNQPAVDTSTFLQLSLLGPFGYIPMALGLYRRRQSQVTRTQTLEINESAFTNFYTFFKTHIEPLPWAKSIGLDDNYFKKHHTRMQINSMLTHVRMLLIQKKWKESRQVLRSIIPIWYKGTPFQKSRWILAYVLGMLHLNFEFFNKLLGRKYYS